MVSGLYCRIIHLYSRTCVQMYRHMHYQMHARRYIEGLREIMRGGETRRENDKDRLRWIYAETAIETEMQKNRDRVRTWYIYNECVRVFFFMQLIACVRACLFPYLDPSMCVHVCICFWIHAVVSSLVVSDVCGQPTIAPEIPERSRGSDAKKHSWPWVVSLVVLRLGHVCSGSVLDHQWIVTAAHCVYVWRCWIPLYFIYRYHEWNYICLYAYKAEMRQVDMQAFKHAYVFIRFYQISWFIQNETYR